MPAQAPSISSRYCTSTHETPLVASLPDQLTLKVMPPWVDATVATADEGGVVSRAMVSV
jgi:hypothetical protein